MIDLSLYQRRVGRGARALSHGFSLIELMVVVAIVGILAAIAVPMYQEYTAKSRVSEGLGLADAMKHTIVENINSGNATLVANPCAGVEPLSSRTRNTRSITCTGAGVLTLTMELSASTTFEITLTPSFVARGNRLGQLGDSRVTWTCQTDTANHKYVPAECRNSLLGNAS